MSNVDVVKHAYAAFARGDVAAVVDAMDPGIEWRQAEGNPYMPSGEAWVGPEAIVNNLFVRLGAEWDAFAVHPNAYHDAGDTVVVEGRYSGTYKDTGKSMDTQVCHVWRLRNGKIIRFQQYVDTAQVQDVMGVRLST
jgi:ketosteroid isomerase-like protein